MAVFPLDVRLREEVDGAVAVTAVLFGNLVVGALLVTEVLHQLVAPDMAVFPISPGYAD